MKSSSYLVEGFKPLLYFGERGVGAPNFDLWILSLRMQAISYHSARITVGGNKGELHHHLCLNVKADANGGGGFIVTMQNTMVIKFP